MMRLLIHETEKENDLLLIKSVRNRMHRKSYSYLYRDRAFSSKLYII